MLLVVFIEVAYAFGLLCFACELGERFRNLFEEIAVTIDQFNWYLFPFEMQRTLPIIILNVQQPVAIACFGSILCDRNSFKFVSSIHRSSSFYDVFRIKSKKFCICR